MTDKIFLLLRAPQGILRFKQSVLRAFVRVVSVRRFARFALQSAESVQHAQMRGGIQQGEIRKLPVNFQNAVADRFQHADADGRVVDESLAFAVFVHDAAQNDVLTVGINAAFLQGFKNLVIFRQGERRAHGQAIRPPAHQRRFAAPAQSKRQGIEQNGFARPRFARQHVQSVPEFQIQFVNQHDIADT